MRPREADPIERTPHIMKNARTKSLRGLAMLVAVSMLSMILAPAAFAQGKQDFTLTNKTGLVISELYVGPSSSNDWGEDILGQDTLDDGASTDIVFSPRTRSAKWDLRIVDENGKAYSWYNINLLEISEITLYYKDGKTWANYK
jgi:hypothetical protein